MKHLEDKDVKGLVDELKTNIGYVEHDGLKSLLSKIFSDPDIMESFITNPGAASNHHAYKHGLLEHTVEVVRLSNEIQRGLLDKDVVSIDLLIAGALLHDIGKTREYEIHGRIMNVRREYHLVYHTVIGVTIINTYNDELKTKDLPHLNGQEMTELSHMIVSHHGKKEYGSPVEPSTVEAFILSRADSISAFVNNPNGREM
jgi:3'-5' exoribonuclease